MKHLTSTIVTLLVLIATALGQVDLPLDVISSLRKTVDSELKGRAVTPIGDATVAHVVAYEGSAFTPDVEFVYQVFPTLEFFRVIPTKKAVPDGVPGGWLYMSCEDVAPAEAVKIQSDGKFSLNERLRIRVLNCASGVLYRDITTVELSCRKLQEHDLYSHKMRTFASKDFAVRILLDPQHKAIAINSSNHWKDAPERE